MRKNSEPSFLRALILKVGGLGWALPLDTLQEIVHLAHLSAPHTSSEFLEGFLDLAGDLVPVLRLAKLFGLEAPPDSLYTPILVLKEASLGLLVDEVQDVIDIPAPILRPKPREPILNDFVQAEFPHQDRSVYLIEPHKILLREEKECLGELQKEYSRRLARLGPKA